jgi:hypothetical protein
MADNWVAMHSCLVFITTLLGPAGNIQLYVHEYYSVARFKATYAHALLALEGKQQWA